MKNKTAVRAAVLLAIVVAAFMLKNPADGYFTGRLGSFVNIETAAEVMRLGRENDASFSLLKNGRFDFPDANPLSGWDPSLLEAYFSAVRPEKNAASANAGATKPPAPSYKVGAVFCGSRKSYAVIDGQLLATGETTPYGEKLIKIENNRVQIDGIWGKRWITVN